MKQSTARERGQFYSDLGSGKNYSAADGAGPFSNGGTSWGDLEQYTQAGYFGDSSTDITDTTQNITYPQTGEWAQLTLPCAIRLEFYTLVAGGRGKPTTWLVAGSTDGQQWQIVDDQRGQSALADHYEPDSSTGNYTSFRLIVYGASGALNVGQWNLYSSYIASPPSTPPPSNAALAYGLGFSLGGATFVALSAGLYVWASRRGRHADAPAPSTDQPPVGARPWFTRTRPAGRN